MSDRIRVAATGAGVNYYPEFLARELGYFEDEGLKVLTEAPGHGPYVPRALAEGAVEIGLGGIWRPLMYRGRLSSFMPFTQLCLRCPNHVLAREPRSDFDWTDLIGRKVLVPDGSPTPFIYLVAILKENGIDPGAVRFIRDFHAAETEDLYRGGLGEFVVTASPLSEVLVDQGLGHRVADLGDAGGPVPWSVYYSLPAFLARPDNAAGRFGRAIQRALTWTTAHDAADAPGVFARQYPGVRPEMVVDAWRRYRAGGMWSETIRLDADAFGRWQKTIIANHLIDAPFAYEDAFDTRVADWVEAQAGP
ncbi:MAG: ABC transporter substrate-binding protein [Rhodospirillales bacterium]|nr:ABC transporter substrate-binding protein [Rhodospirillales bacterium]